ncbi:uncharacterized protein FTOL_05190 [Fusarium torulosum]|nr:uncharacterized protein FTOL_05190 [Fusarium torulosum]
MVLILT